VFTWLQDAWSGPPAPEQTLAVECDTLEAKRRDAEHRRGTTGESYQKFLTRLAWPPPQDAEPRALAGSTAGARSGRPHRMWVNPVGPDSRSAAERRTDHLAHKSEHAVDLESRRPGRRDPARGGRLGQRVSRDDADGANSCAVQATVPTALVGESRLSQQRHLLTLRPSASAATSLSPIAAVAAGPRSRRPSNLSMAIAVAWAAHAEAVDAASGEVRRADVCARL